MAPNSKGAAPTVAIETHGCKLNMADSQRLAREFLHAGFAVDGTDEPDVYVLNSCTVTHVADRKARRALSAARRSHPAALVVASGCFAERSPAAVEALEAVDLVVTNRDKAHLVQMVAARLGIQLGQPPQFPRSPESPGRRLLGRTRAFIKIQEGCDQVCAYCIVPRVRGRERSVPVEDLVEQVRTAAGEGVKEVVLTGTQLGTYGFETLSCGLPDLLKRLLNETDVPRIRVSSLQPPEMTGELLELWSGVGRGRLCPHFHMPLQSGSDAILARMRRRYTARQYLEAVERAKLAAPDAAITTDAIAGFPGETDADFETTADVMRLAGLAGAHVFPFSARPGTSAARFPGQVPVDVRIERAAGLRRVAEAGAAEFRSRLAGHTRPVLWESSMPLSGMTDNYVRVEMVEGAAGLEPADRVPVGRSRMNRIEEVLLVGVAGDHMLARRP
ncbi:MAG: tRNA (N(6)-L-threonylcarbamoyladenosine(37)-C(2))-methylthiotransferase MtaB [Chloroflexi bacterium]|nr:tRNA (N(6)-L-threonylcarbamoyladenosine(37)-C(2))-methylthiotransferase MtaB [Chloroflexota bacterium]